MTIDGKNPWPALEQIPVVAPSLLSVDFARAGEQIDQVLAAGAQVLHVDIMDGHFVPNLSMGPPVVQKFRRYTQAPLDVHLMVTEPGFFIEPFAKAGADSLNFHIETCNDSQARELIARIRGLGLGVGVTLKPATPAAAIESVAEEVDMVLIMTVEPGFGGQSFMADMLPKIQTIREMLRPEQRLEVDGGIAPDTAALCAQAGADTFVAGNNVFAAEDPAKAVHDLLDAIGAKS